MRTEPSLTIGVYMSPITLDGAKFSFASTIGTHMADEDIWRKVYGSTLEARLVLSEIRRASLNFEIDSPLITSERMAKAMAERDQGLIEWGTIMTELEEQKDPGLAKFK